MNIHQLRITIAEAIEGTEFAGKVYFAGGAVRDLLIHRQTEDFDLTVELPRGGILLAAFLHTKLASGEPFNYPKFGTAYINYQGITIEFVMTRRELYNPGNRNPKVEFGSLQDDVFRRDFTINSLLLSVSGGNLVDLTKMGLRDLNDGLIRTPIDPRKSFMEDPLRMLRAIRFATLLGYSFESNTWDALRECAPQVRSLARPRISDEFSKIMVSSPVKHLRNRKAPEGEAAARGFELLMQSGIMDSIMPEDQRKLELLSEKRFSLTSEDLMEYFGVLEASRIQKMLKFARMAWYDNPESSTEELLAYIKEKKL